MIDLVFAMLTALSCGYAWQAGGNDGKRISLLFSGVWLVSIPATLLQNDPGLFNIYLFVVDVVILVVLWPAAMRSRCYWPVWLLGFHFASLSTDLIGFTLEGRPALVYYVLHAFWSLPELLVMPIGIHLDRAARFPGLRQFHPC